MRTSRPCPRAASFAYSRNAARWLSRSMSRIHRLSDSSRRKATFRRARVTDVSIDRVLVCADRNWRILGEDNVKDAFGTPGRRTFLAGMLGTAGLVVAGCDKASVGDVPPQQPQPPTISPS